jgi:hypothetical protein
MRKILFLGIIFGITLLGCSKQIQEGKPTTQDLFKSDAMLWVNSRVSEKDKQLLIPEKSVLIKSNTNYNTIIIPLTHSEQKEYLIVSQKKGGFNGAFILFDKTNQPQVSIIISNIDRKKVTKHQLPISSSGIRSNNQFSSTTNNLVKSLDTDLPPVVVTGYRRTTNNTSFFFSMFWMYGGNSDFSNDFVAVDQEAASDGNLASGDVDPVVVEIEPDESENKDSITIRKFIDCFSLVSDVDASYTVKIHADIPINSNPDLLFNLSQVSPGHVFLRLTKIGANGQEITQTIGFYPEKGYKSILNPFGNVNSKIVNDGENGKEHEYNASFAVAASKNQFEAVLNHLESVSTSYYNLTQYNCAHFAIAAFREVAPNFASIPMFFPFGPSLINLSASPIGVYETLRTYNSLNTPNTEFNVVKKARTSKGPCN